MRGADVSLVLCSRPGQTFDPNASTAEKAAEAGNVAHLNDHQGYHGLGDAKKTGGAQCECPILA